MNQSETLIEGLHPIEELERQIEKLLGSHGRLAEENRVLRDEQHNLLSENKMLIERNQQVTRKFESLVKRLREINGQHPAPQ